MWTVGHDPCNGSIRERIRRAWHELVGEREWTDECILTPTAARELALVLEEEAWRIESTQPEYTI
jgi:hypothetical protein